VSTTPVANLPPVSTTPAANFATSSPSVVDTGGKAGGKLPPVSTTPAANFATSSPSVVHTGGKFAAGVNDACGKLPPVSTTPAANLPPVSLTPVANNGNNIRPQTPESELEGKILYICFLYYQKVTKQNYLNFSD
jgi:hypothetical protein